jgi:hypothetical protein
MRKLDIDGRRNSRVLRSLSFQDWHASVLVSDAPCADRGNALSHALGLLFGEQLFAGRLHRCFKYLYFVRCVGEAPGNKYLAPATLSQQFGPWTLEL